VSGAEEIVSVLPQAASESRRASESNSANSFFICITLFINFKAVTITVYKSFGL